MRAICVRGKQAESPVRGKFTLVWWREEVEERQDRCCRGQSPRTGAAEPERERLVPEREEEEEEEEEERVQA